MNLKDLSSNWDEVLRLLSSIRLGTVTASEIVGKLAKYPRQNRLVLITAAIALWNVAHLPAAVAELRSRSKKIPDEHLGHLTPLGWEHITLTGTYRLNLTATSTLENFLHHDLQ